MDASLINKENFDNLSNKGSAQTKDDFGTLKTIVFDVIIKGAEFILKGKDDFTKENITYTYRMSQAPVVLKNKLYVWKGNTKEKLQKAFEQSGLNSKEKVHGRFLFDSSKVTDKKFSVWVEGGLGVGVGEPDGYIEAPNINEAYKKLQKSGTNIRYVTLTEDVKAVVKDSVYTYSDINKIGDKYKETVKQSRGRKKGIQVLEGVAKQLGYTTKLSNNVVKLLDDKGAWLLIVSSDGKSIHSSREGNAMYDKKPLTADIVIKAIDSYKKVLDYDKREYRGSGNITEQNANSVMYNLLEKARHAEKKADVANAIKEVKAIIKKHPYGGSSSVVSFSTIKSKLSEAEQKLKTMDVRRIPFDAI